MTTTSILSLLLAFCVSLASSRADDKKPAQNKKNTAKNSAQSVSKDASVVIAGKTIHYTVTASELTLKKDDGTERATIFHFSYLAKNVKDNSKRPVLFAFNGGPGSSAVWLHLGALGPKIVPTSADGTEPLTPPVTVVDNPLSILDVADLVFIDPVSTGLSRTQKGARSSEFHSIEGDISSVGDFIRRWITEHKRWASPKFLIGESYGGVRAAGLAHHLQSRYGMQLNGVILLSSLLDFRTLSPSAGNDLSYVTYLPSLTATAIHHKVLSDDANSTLLKASKVFADGKYLQALHRGYTLTEAEVDNIASELARFTGIKKQDIIDHKLRIHPSYFRAKLLASQRKVLGRFDARVAWDTANSSATRADIDPSFAVAKGPFSTAMLSYLTGDLGWDDSRVYEILTNKVHPWKWNAENHYVNLAPRLQQALNSNPKLRILVQCGRTDLATPAGGILHSINHLRLTPAQRANISVQWYDAGHMFYLNQPDLEKMRVDLKQFIEQ